MCLVSHCPCQLNHAESGHSCKKKSEICTLAKSRRLMPVPWKPLQTLWKLKLKISRTLWTCACAFSPDLLALMLDYTPSVPPLPPLKYGSDGRKGQSQYGGGSSGGDGWEGGGWRVMCHSEPSLTFTGPKTRERERGVDDDGGGGGACLFRFMYRQSFILLLYYSFYILLCPLLFF